MESKEKLMLSNNREVNLTWLIIMVSFALILVMGVLGFGENAHAQGATINAASCSYADVSEAITAASPGDTVMVPAGQCTWASGVSIPDNKKITLKGAGMDSTVITRDGTAINMNQSGARVTGIGFVLPSGGSGNQIISVKGIGWRIDHCKFTNNSGDSRVSIDASGRNVNQYPIGLVDNCVFINGRILTNGAYTFEGMSMIWAGDLNLGTEDAVYIEDCEFTRNDSGIRNTIDGNRGGMTVFRYNSVENSSIEAHSLQNDNERAFRKWETYGNTFHAAADMYIPIRFIAGTGVIFNNQFSGDYNLRGIDFYNRRCYASIGEAGFCDGSSAWDGNQDANGWPCRDQIGRGPDKYVFDKDNPPYPPQESVPAYLWLNRDLGFSGGSSDIANVLVSNNSGDHIKPNRDYYNEVASFDGTSGVGTGSLANRPSTCTPGVAYWATDQGEWNSENPGPDGQLYKCTSTDTWELYYIPYTYPHPLRGESGPGAIHPTRSKPDNFTLRQNYPNPFNPSTTIEYSVAKPCNVRIIIYNQLGQEIRMLVNELKPAGEYNVRWDGRDAKGNKLASGVYFYRLTAGKQVSTKKMLYLR